MSNHSILQKEVLSNNLPRNSFDLSFRHLFTADAGELLPVYTEHVNPNERFRINPQIFLRCQTLNTAAFTRLTQNIDFFFVPYRLLSSYLPQVLVNTDYFVSNVYPEKLISQNVPLVYVGSKLPSQSAFYPINKFDVDTAEVASLNPLHGKVDLFSFPSITKAARLCELLGYTRDTDVQFATASDPNASNLGVSSLNLFAYNNIYYNFYRNPLLERYNRFLINFDDFYSDNIKDKSHYAGNYLNVNYFALNGFFNIKYHNLKSDYFTHCFTDFRSADFVNPSSSPSFSGADISSQSSPAQGILDIDSGSSLSISNLRSAYALDKLLAFSQNAKDGSYTEQIKAHFGFDPGLDNFKPQFIGSCSSPITISDVEGTATTEASSLGQICGKGVSLSNGSFEFSTKEHGVIMGIFYILPETDYSSKQTPDPFIFKTDGTKFFKPEFADLGSQPVPMYELFGPSYMSHPNYQIFGYTNRYSEYKSRVDKISGEFNTDLNAWVTPRQYSNGQDLLEDSRPINLDFTKCNPRGLNNIFAIQADGSHNQFMCAAQFNVNAIRPMSVFGSPYSNI